MSDKPLLVTRYIAYHGDGAVLDCSRAPVNLRLDDEGPTCVVRVVMPEPDYLDIWYYARRDNNGPNPFSDAYEAAQVVAVKAVETEVVACGACDNSPTRSAPCYLCGRE